MTQTNASQPTQGQLDPFGILATLITALLAPMFRGVCGGDINLAFRAAADTVKAYRARNQADLIAVAQIIGFGLASLDSLSLSMAEDVSVSTALRLRSNANACNRAAEHNRRTLAGSLASELQPQAKTKVTPGLTSDSPFLNPGVVPQSPAEQFSAAEPKLPAPSPPTGPTTARTPAEKQHHQQLWAAAMAKHASAITSSLPNLPTAEREEATMRAQLLGSIARDLMQGTPDAGRPFDSTPTSPGPTTRRNNRR